MNSINKFGKQFDLDFLDYILTSGNTLCDGMCIAFPRIEYLYHKHNRKIRPIFVCIGCKEKRICENVKNILYLWKIRIAFQKWFEKSKKRQLNSPQSITAACVISGFVGKGKKRKSSGIKENKSKKRKYKYR